MADESFDMATCLARVAQGDQAAATALVARVHPLVLRLVSAHRPQRCPADDLAQEVLIRMFSRLDRYQARDGVPFEHWLGRMTVNHCRDALRAERRVPRTVALSDASAAWLAALVRDDPPPVDDPAPAAKLVEALLAELPPPDRLVLTLLDLEGRSTSEISAQTGWSRTLVKVRAFRARRRLRAVANRWGLTGDHDA